MAPGGAERAAGEAEPHSKTIGIEKPSFDHLEHVVVKQTELLVRLYDIYLNAFDSSASDGGREPPTTGKYFHKELLSSDVESSHGIEPFGYLVASLARVVLHFRVVVVASRS